MDIIDYAEDEDELHDNYFNVHAGQSMECLVDIDKIRHNDPTFTEFYLVSEGNYFDDMNWKLLGRYIARNTHLTCIDLTEMYFDRRDMENFFSVLPFGSLASVPLKDICIESGLNTVLFESMLKALSGGPIEQISVDNGLMNDGLIDSIEVLHEVKLPCLKHLTLRGNKIVSTSGLEKCVKLETLSMSKNPINSAGCIGISKLLEKSTALEEVCICNTKIGDEGADMLANSLKHNPTCYLLEIEENRITQKGAVSFIKLMSDITSIESTYNSNHVLSDPCLISLDDSNAAKKYVDRCLSINAQPNNINKGRSKVIEFQLNGVKREELHRLQGIEYCYKSIFSEIDHLVLPDVLSLVGREHGQTELYRMLVNSVPDLFSTVNRKVVLKQKLAEKNKDIADKKIEMASLAAQMAALSAEVSEINVELESIEAKEEEREQGKRTRDGRLKH